MTAPFECEVRFPVADVEAFHRRLEQLGARLREAYAFTDHYYQPRGMRWDPRTQALRIREHHAPEPGSEVLLTHVEVARADGLPFKRSRFAEGKVALYAGTLADCRQVVESLGFLPGITMRKRDGRLFEIPEFGGLVTEHVEGVGWMCEVEQEGRDVALAVAGIRAKLARLGVNITEVTGDPVAALVAAAAASAGGRKVYFCGSIRGGRDRQPLYRAIVDFLHGRGFEVLTTHVAAPDVLQREWREGVTARSIYERDLRWLAECDLVIAEVSTPSLGVGVEITEAQHLGKPILVLCHAGVPLSAMIAGNPACRLVTYSDEADLFRKLMVELSAGSMAAGAGLPR
jgi:adenylate cyclase class IV